MFDIAYRDRVRERVLRLAGSDDRIVAGAVIGSFAWTEGDRWSDLDLTFATTDGTDLLAVLDDWRETLLAEFGGNVLFDLPAGSSIYRVFLFPGSLQVDLSISPASEFGAHGCLSSATIRCKPSIGSAACVRKSWPSPADGSD